MRYQIFLIFLVISLLFIGSILSEPNVPSQPNFNTSKVNECLNDYIGPIFDRIISNDSIFKEILERNEYNSMITNGENNDKDEILLKALQQSQKFITKFGQIDSCIEQIDNNPPAAKNTTKELLENHARMVIDEVLRNDDVKIQVIERLFQSDTEDAIIKKVSENSTLVTKLFENPAFVDKINEEDLENATKSENFRKAFIQTILKNGTYEDELLVEKVLSDQTLIGKVLENADGNILVMAVSKNKTDLINAISNENDSFMDDLEFRAAVIKKILGNETYKIEFDDVEIGVNDTKAEKLVGPCLTGNGVKQIILSPMIIAWISSLICIACMCGFCYPFGLSEKPSPSESKAIISISKSKSQRKKRIGTQE
uniref:Uncharacterized protein n=1 Tax=Panagrolaimus sp. PS1159 TaxID=55785 RepID=A0AC35GAE3_9BILA